MTTNISGINLKLNAGLINYNYTDHYMDFFTT